LDILDIPISEAANTLFLLFPGATILIRFFEQLPIFQEPQR